VKTDAAAARLIEANLYKLVNVIYVQDVTPAASVIRELAFIKVCANAEKRPEVMQLAEVFRARVVDLCPSTLVLEITGTQDKVDSLIEVLRPFGITELVRTGAVAMTRGPAAAALSAAPRENSTPSSQEIAA
jgi:acetolactate synthase I/III small subunit